MTVREVKEEAERLHPGYLTDKEKTEGILRLESILTGHLHDYIHEGDDIVLTAPYCFCELYTLYLAALGEAKMEEHERYNNTMLRFRTLYNEYATVTMREKTVTRAELKLI